MVTRWTSILLSVQKFGLIRTLTRLFSILFFKTGFKNYVTEKGIGKIYLRRGTSDLPVYRQVFLNGEYEIKINGTPKVIIDLGANIGLFSLLMRKKFPYAKIIAIEADPKNFLVLRQNMERFSEVFCINAAIWNTKTKLKIDSSDNTAEWGRTVSSITNEEKNITVIDAITMRDVKNEYYLETIDILKIDIEGAEYELFLTDTEWLDDVKVVIVEFHDSIKKNSSNSFFKTLANRNDYSFGISGENVVVEFSKSD